MTMTIVGIVLFVLFGLVVGLVARAIMPGRQPMGLVMTAFLGMAGSLAGGLLFTLIRQGRIDLFEPLGLIGSVIGAFVLLGLYVIATRSRDRPIIRPRGS